MLLIFLTIHTIYSFQYVYIFAVQLYMNYENLSPATLSYFNDSVWSEYLPCMVVTSSRSHCCSVVISFQFLDIHQLECTVCQLCGILCYRCQVSVHIYWHRMLCYNTSQHYTICTLYIQCLYTWKFIFTVSSHLVIHLYSLLTTCSTSVQCHHTF